LIGKPAQGRRRMIADHQQQQDAAEDIEFNQSLHNAFLLANPMPILEITPIFFDSKGD
jgi:hypothetical protein